MTGPTEGGTRVTARSLLSIVAGGRRRRILKDTEQIGACGAAGGPCGEAGDRRWFLGMAVLKESPLTVRHTATATSRAHLPSLVKRRGVVGGSRTGAQSKIE
jgi:hypothetical protein